MIAIGVKFRKSPTHTCDKFKPKLIHIPKIEGDNMVTIEIQKGGIIETKKALLVRCTKQIIEGVTIPNGYEVWIPAGCVELIICVMKSGLNNPKGSIDNVVYIGSSNDIRKRILNPTHVYRRLLNILKNYWVYTYFLECDNHIQFERELIRKYKPQFNRTLYGT